MSEPTTARLSEASHQRAVVELAQHAGWRCYHTHDSRRSAAGFPDLTLVRGDQLLFAELKTDHGRLSAEQRGWLQALEQVPGAQVCVWRPADWDEIVSTLMRTPSAIRPRTKPERMALLNGFAMAIEAIGKHDLQFARGELRTMMAAEGLTA